tara:strand:+ start:1090 stop:1350 length:261 start_codon:yes stop_codon:yes gene_type:complete
MQLPEENLVHVQCADCDMRLMEFIKIRESNKEHKFKVLCPGEKCEGSWEVEIIGDCVYNTPEGLVIENMNLNEETGVMTIEVNKNE